MIPVDQTTFGPLRSDIASREVRVGNCFSACVASILELPIDDVPQFNTPPSFDVVEPDAAWWERFKEWLAVRCLFAVCFDRRPDSEPPPGWPKGYSIAGGMSPRNKGVMHAAVCLDGVLVHDPNPERTFFAGEVMDWIVIGKLRDGESGERAVVRIIGEL